MEENVARGVYLPVVKPLSYFFESSLLDGYGNCPFGGGLEPLLIVSKKKKKKDHPCFLDYRRDLLETGFIVIECPEVLTIGSFDLTITLFIKERELKWFVIMKH